MLISFLFSNYRSFRDDATLSMEAVGLKEHKEIITKCNGEELLPCVSIYGKNGGGKSNVIRALWLSVQFICNAQRTQHEKATVPVRPFLLDSDSVNRPTFFEYTYIYNGIKYKYGFAATRNEVTREYLYYWPKGNKASIFDRTGQEFHFVKNSEKRQKEVIASAVAPNQLFLAIACALNYLPCIQAMRWFRECIFFSRDFVDIPEQLSSYSGDEFMLKAITKIAKKADVGIEDMSFEFKDRMINLEETLPDSLSIEEKGAIANLFRALSSEPNEAETKLMMSEVKATSFHYGIGPDGKQIHYALDLADESDGTKKLMSLAPAIEKALKCGGVLVIDEIEKRLHPILVCYIVLRFQSKKENPNGAQLIFTTHETELMDIVRKDQIYFVDKGKSDGKSELYSVLDTRTRTGENIRKGYLAGKYGATPDIDLDQFEEV